METALIGKRVEINLGSSIYEMGSITGESDDKSCWIIEPDDPRITSTVFAKSQCELK